jgi:hypothetical protein
MVFQLKHKDVKEIEGVVISNRIYELISLYRRDKVLRCFNIVLSDFEKHNGINTLLAIDKHHNRVLESPSVQLLIHIANIITTYPDFNYRDLLRLF